MPRHLVLIGGGHAHMVTLAHLRNFTQKGHRVSVIGPSPYHYYSGMGPGMLGGTYTPEEIRFATRHVVEKNGGTFITDKVLRIDARQREIFLESGQHLPYDVLSCNAGSYVPQPRMTAASADIFGVKPIEKLIDARTRILEKAGQRHISVGIVGGGPSAVEIAGNAWQLAKRHAAHMPDIAIFAASRLMNTFPDSIRKMAVRSLTRRSIQILEHSRVNEITDGRVRLENGREQACDLIFLALGVKPSQIFSRSGLPTGPDGGLRVNRYLQCVAYPEIFGGGDCIYFEDHPLDKVGVYAVRQNPVLYHNLMASLEDRPLEPFHHGGTYLLIFNLGGRRGILHKSGITFGGWPAFIAKDYIDRRFMRRFQAIE